MLALVFSSNSSSRITILTAPSNQRLPHKHISPLSYAGWTSFVPIFINDHPVFYYFFSIKKLINVDVILVYFGKDLTSTYNLQYFWVSGRVRWQYCEGGLIRQYEHQSQFSTC